jgi:hypothetical protein
MGAGCGRSKQRTIHNPLKVQRISEDLINPNEFFKPVKSIDQYDKRVKYINITRDVVICTRKVSDSHIRVTNAGSVVKRKSTTDLIDIQVFSFRMSSPKYSDQSVNKENTKQSDFEEMQLTKRQGVLDETDKTILKEVVCKNVLKEITLITPKSKGILPL